MATTANAVENRSDSDIVRTLYRRAFSRDPDNEEFEPRLWLLLSRSERAMMTRRVGSGWLMRCWRPMNLSSWTSTWVTEMMRQSDTTFTRRSILKRAGMGIGMLAFADLVASGTCRGRSDTLSGQSKTRDSCVSKWRHVASGHIRPEAGAHEAWRANAAVRQFANRTEDRVCAAFAVQVSRAWRKRNSD